MFYLQPSFNDRWPSHISSTSAWDMPSNTNVNRSTITRNFPEDCTAYETSSLSGEDICSTFFCVSACSRLARPVREDAVALLHFLEAGRLGPLSSNDPQKLICSCTQVILGLIQSTDSRG